MRRCSAASDDQKRAANTARYHILPNPAAIRQREGQENREAQKQHAAARLHRLIECRRGVNQHCTHQGRCRDCKNVLGRITESELFDSTIVPTHKIQRCYNYTKLDKIDDEKLKLRGIKCVVSKPACNSVNSEPARYI